MIKQYLERFGQEVRLGFSWPWIHTLPDEAQAPWSFVAISSETPFTHRELQEALAASSSPELKERRWAMIRALDPDQYDVDVRARDLVLRMNPRRACSQSSEFSRSASPIPKVKPPGEWARRKDRTAAGPLTSYSLTCLSIPLED